MKEAKNELLQFVGGGLYILSQKVMVSSLYGFFSLWGGRFSSGLIMVPLIIGVVWMFATGGSFVSKVFTVLSVILIIASIVASTRIWLVSINGFLYLFLYLVVPDWLQRYCLLTISQKSPRKISQSRQAAVIHQV